MSLKFGELELGVYVCTDSCECRLLSFWLGLGWCVCLGVPLQCWRQNKDPGLFVYVD